MKAPRPDIARVFVTEGQAIYSFPDKAFNIRSRIGGNSDSQGTSEFEPYLSGLGDGFRTARDYADATGLDERLMRAGAFLMAEIEEERGIFWQEKQGMKIDRIVTLKPIPVEPRDAETAITTHGYSSGTSFEVDIAFVVRGMTADSTGKVQAELVAVEIFGGRGELFHSVSASEFPRAQ
jgi:hypothetical protein